jgi:rhodanese-related sulfurtransferase
MTFPTHTRGRQILANIAFWCPSYPFSCEFVTLLKKIMLLRIIYTVLFFLVLSVSYAESFSSTQQLSDPNEDEITFPGRDENIIRQLECSADFEENQSEAENIHDSVEKRAKLTNGQYSLALKQCQIGFRKAYGVWLQDKLKIVDVRGSNDFDKYRIPNSLNIPLHSIKTKPFLKNQFIVLVDKGNYQKPLYEECYLLRQMGYENVKVLDGGIRKWWQKAELEGNEIEIQKLKRVSPKEFEMAKDEKNWYLLNMSGEELAVSSFGLSKESVLTYVGNKDQFFKKLLALMDSDNSKHIFLVLNKDGKDYQRYSALLKRAGMSNEYYLVGGLENYVKFKKNQKALIARVIAGPKKVQPCGG